MPIVSAMPFREALARLGGKRVLPTNLSSAEIRDLEAAVRERSFFSARTVLGDYLEEVKQLALDTVDGRLDPATFRLRAKEFLRRKDYAPDETKRGSIEDLSSDRRLNLVIKTNVEMAQNYGHFRQGQVPEILDRWPAQELFRAESRREERDWAARWRLAGQMSGQPGWISTPDGRMVALKNHPIWERLGSSELFDDGLDNPWPPFAFGSGMDVRDISREEAVQLGLMEPGTQVTPAPPGFEMREAA
jgi:hypothetical protein